MSVLSCYAGSWKLHRHRLTAATVALSSLLPVVTVSAASPAGTDITNIAHISFVLDGVRTRQDSNIVHTVVNEQIDVMLQPAAPGAMPVQAGDKAVLAFTLTNTGNGAEAFIPGVPTVTGKVGLVVQAVVADSNGNGQYDAGTDQVIPIGEATPVLAPGAGMLLFVMGQIPSGGISGAVGAVNLSVTAAAGDGPKGTILARHGQSGGDAVVGASTANASVPLVLGGLVATLVKTQNVAGINGSTEPRRGATITYSLEGRFAGSGVATGLTIGDSIPAGTIYVPGSMTLDGAVLSDVADGDAGTFDGMAIAVSLDHVAAPAVHVVSFKVRIN